MLYANRYILQNILGSGGMGTVYAAEDRFTGETVALKQLATVQGDLQFASRGKFEDARLALAQEFRLLASLRHPHIISVYDYGFDADQQPFYTMELLPNALPLLDVAQAYPADEKLRLLLQAAQALTYLHRRGVLHRDLSPNNVVIIHENQVKLLDFGLAVTVETQKNVALGGTMPYVAPELLQGDDPTPAADLYALGVLAYELFVGKHPFYADTVNELIANTLTQEPDLTPLPAFERGDISLCGVIKRLLDKDPRGRLADASHLVDELSALVGQTPETITIRESFLQAADFVGRDEELDTLLTALDSAAAGQGSMWLIAGESGVGKSRLLDEIRAHGLVQGALVLQGQAVASGGLPYQLWRTIVRHLALLVDLDDTEASILQEIVPDLPDLLGRAIPPIAELTGPAQQQRLVLTIATLLQRQTQSVILLLEDLQWSTESLQPLKHLMQIVAKLPVLVLATFRDDERPDLPAELPTAQVLKLERLNRAAMSELSQSMLGEAGQRTELLDLLERESEGNIFFIVEIMRALAEDAGQLTDIAAAILPERVFPDGMRQIITRRLAQVPEADQDVLKLAAIQGRQLDLRVLRQVVSDVDLDSWALRCAAVTVLDLRAGQWQFAHDKLREAVLETLPDAERVGYHRQIALGIETIYPDDPAYAFILVQHWRQAGDTKKETGYTNQAAYQARRAGNSAQAIALYSRTVELADTVPVDKTAALLGLGSVHRLLGAFDEAVAVLQEVIDHAGASHNKVVEAQALASLAKALRNSGRYKDAEPFSQQSLEIAQSIPDDTLAANALQGLVLGYTKTGKPDIALEYAEQCLAVNRRLDNKPGLADTLNALAILSWIKGDYAGAETYLTESLTLWRELGALQGIANSLDNLGAIAATLGKMDQARRQMEESMTIRRRIVSLPALANVLGNLAGLHIDLGDFDTAQEYAAEALEIQRSTNDVDGITNSLSIIGNICIYLDDWQRGLDAFDEALTLAYAQNNRFVIARTLVSRATLWQKIGQLAPMQADLIETLDHARAVNALPVIVDALCGFAHLAFMTGQFDHAAGLVGVIQRHGAVIAGVIQSRLDEVMNDLDTALSPEELAACLPKYADQELDEVLDRLVRA